MDPTLGRLALNLGMVLLVLTLVALPFIDRSSPEFVLAILGLAISGTFVILVAYEIRREAKLGTRKEQ